MAKNMHNKPFSVETHLKLDIFRECFKEWFPVFIYQPFWQELFVYDFFAGSGFDIDGNAGSPIILLEEARGENAKFCNEIKKSNKKITFIFNEHEPIKKQDKYSELKTNIENHLIKCKQTNNCNFCCFTTEAINIDFGKEFDTNDRIKNNLKNKKTGKFVILDQYGFSQVDSEVFLTLVNAPHTDFIFFISSSYLRRFSEVEACKNFLGNKKLSFEQNEPKKCHQVIVDYFESLLPREKEYYLNHFTIKKGSNYYGLIFGTAHTLGMEKFQRVCWNVDSQAGESNCNTQNDFEPDSLFGSLETNKILTVKKQLEKDILYGNITDNITGLKKALSLRCLPKIFTEVVQALEQKNKIKKIGSIKNKSTDIHRIKENDDYYYKIKVLT